jgi:hypothetical protein
MDEQYRLAWADIEGVTYQVLRRNFDIVTQRSDTGPRREQIKWQKSN